MNKWINKIKNPKLTKILLVALFILVVLLIYIFNNSETEKLHTVKTHTIEEVVLLSGSVRGVSQVDLSFGTAGKIATTTVSQGDYVSKGQILAELNYETLKADLKQAESRVLSAESNVSLAKASVEKAEANLAVAKAQNRGIDSSIAAAKVALENTINEQEVLVKNALSDLLNNDLKAYPIDNYRNVTPPTISGNYISEEKGEYILDFYNSSGKTGFSIRVSGLETSRVSFDDFGIPTTLGDRGLYLTLLAKSEGEQYGNTNWVVPVPNTRSLTYQTKLGSYNKALQTKASAISKAQSNLDILIAQQENKNNSAITTAQEKQAKASLEEANANLNKALSNLNEAKAGVLKIESLIEDNIIRSPFDGTVARFNFKVGQSVGQNQSGITVITNGNYELAMSIPEVDIAKLKVGDKADIILDAYGTDVIWEGAITEIELVETEIDGVPSYASTITILEPDSRIKIGMNARARIVAKEKRDVLAIPTSYLIKNGEIYTVLVKKNKRQTEERIVEVGLRGSDFFVEIVDGIKFGETIIAPVKDK